MEGMTIYSPLEEVKHPLLEEKEVRLWVKRDDLIHPEISGNKWRKLKYNLSAAKEMKQQTLLTFGGAYSNHILALAAAANKFGFKSIGVIRGEAHKDLNPTLQKAVAHGMQLHYMDRETYRHKMHEDNIKKLKTRFGSFYLIPEGGSNDLAVKSCAEINNEIAIDFDMICSAAGTGATGAGLLAGLKANQKYIAFPVLKGGTFLKEEIANFVKGYPIKGTWDLQTDYHFGGYGKVKKELIDFINQFKKDTAIALDPVYTGKMCFGVFDMIEKDHFPKNSKIVILHTGGLQGIAGMNERIASKGWRIE